MKRLLFLSIVLLGELQMLAQQTISLAGTWDFAMDASSTRADRTAEEADTIQYDDRVTLPGSMVTNVKGIPVSSKTQWTATLHHESYVTEMKLDAFLQDGNFKWPHFLIPERTYMGYAW